MTTTEPRPTRVARLRRRHPLLRRAVLSGLSFTVLLALVAGGLGLVEYHRLNNQITHVDVLQRDDPNIRQAAAQRAAVNYLVIGSDSRAGTTSSVAGERSDTTILIHLSQNRKHVTVVSIPRDSWVTIPACTVTSRDFGRVGSTAGQHQDLFNSAFSLGGAKCTIATVQKLTGVAVTHYLKLDFVGFEKVVDALGTIPVCSTEAVTDPDAHLSLTKGVNQLDGKEALAYVRARHAFGDGSDLGRIKRQQQFLGIVLRKALSGSLLSDPVRLTGFLDAVTRSITTDRATSVSDLRTLGSSMSGLNPKRVAFYTAPIADPDYSPPGTDQTGKVLLDAAKGRVLYDSIIDDTAVASTPAEAGATSTAPKANGDAAQDVCA